MHLKRRYRSNLNESVNQNVYSAPSRYLLRVAPDPGQADKNSLEKVVELSTSTIWEVPYSYFKSILDRKGTCLHCRRAGECGHQITEDRGPPCTTTCTRRERAAELAQIGGRSDRQAPLHQGRDPVCDDLWRWKPVNTQYSLLSSDVMLVERGSYMDCRI